MKCDITDNQQGTIYNNIAQRLADGLLPDPTPTELRSAKIRPSKKPSFKKGQFSSLHPKDRYRLSIPSVPASRYVLILN